MIDVWTVAVGNIPPFWFLRKRARKALNLVKEQEGLVGIYQEYPNGTLLLFDTENNAKGARNMLKYHGIECGVNICKVQIDERELHGKGG